MTEEGTEESGRKEVIAKHGRCGTCFYSDLEHAGTVECRRFPPAPYFEPTGRVSNIRPRVGAYYWCGEYRTLATHGGSNGGMMHGPSGLKLLYDIRHAMGFSDLHGLSQLAGDIALLRKSYLWGPIEYAPRDGTHVLVKFEGTSSPPTVAHYWSAPDDHGGWFLSVQQYEGPEIHPTHWQRLPAGTLATHGGSNGG